MKKYVLLIHLFIFCGIIARSQPALPVWNKEPGLFAGDWLLAPVTQKAALYLTPDKKDLVLYNGLVKRVFRIGPNTACTDYTNMSTGQQLLRSVKPEAILTINGRKHNVGGLYGQKENAYLLPAWVDGLQKNNSDFQLSAYDVKELPPYLNPVSKVWATHHKAATGKLVQFHYISGLAELKGITVTVNYELYDGIPLICKWLSLTNNSEKPIQLNRVISEVLGMVEEQSAVVGKPEQMKKPQGLYIESNYAFNNAMRYDLSDQTTHWKTDSTYTSQVNYDLQTPCLLEVYPEYAPGIEMKPGDNFVSVRTYELAMDSYDRERRGLSVQQMYRTIAPWTTGNPVFMHLVSKTDGEVKSAVDQCANTGYEALILSFGSHINMEDTSKENILRWRSLADYAHQKNIKIGGYSLFSSRKISDADDVIDARTGKPGGAFFGNAPCFGSYWGLGYRDKIKTFFRLTGFDIWENDGPYPGDRCASTIHPGHKGLDDSQWRQMEIQKDLYQWLNKRGVYINAPDWYFLDGTNKIALGYREVNFSLPRSNQKLLNRQNIYDGTWDKLPSMGWGFVPLTRYQGGGPEAILEPLSQHLPDYEQLMMQYYGAGVQACYRGPRLYDNDTTKAVVVKVINWYKKYRDILNSSIIHLRRADGRDWDGILHVNPALKTRGLMMLYNPTGQKIERDIKIPLYYTGLTQTARIREKESPAKSYSLNRNYEATVRVTLAPNSYSWWLVE